MNWSCVAIDILSYICTHQKKRHQRPDPRRKESKSWPLLNIKKNLLSRKYTLKTHKKVTDLERQFGKINYCDK